MRLYGIFEIGLGSNPTSSTGPLCDLSPWNSHQGVKVIPFVLTLSGNDIKVAEVVTTTLSERGILWKDLGILSPGWSSHLLVGTEGQEEVRWMFGSQLAFSTGNAPFKAQ